MNQPNPAEKINLDPQFCQLSRASNFEGAVKIRDLNPDLDTSQPSIKLCPAPKTQPRSTCNFVRVHKVLSRSKTSTPEPLSSQLACQFVIFFRDKPRNTTMTWINTKVCGNLGQSVYRPTFEIPTASLHMRWEWKRKKAPCLAHTAISFWCMQ